MVSKIKPESMNIHFVSPAGIKHQIMGENLLFVAQEDTWHFFQNPTFCSMWAQCPKKAFMVDLAGCSS